MDTTRASQPRKVGQRRWNVETDLVTTPLQARQEDNHAGDGEEASDEVNLANELLLRQSLRVDAWWREVENRGHDQADKSPHGTQEADVAPTVTRGNQLAPQHRRAERQDGEDH